MLPSTPPVHEVAATSVGFDDAVLGHGLPHEVEALIARAGLLGAERRRAEDLLLEARRRAPRHPATLIALYRHYFYGGQLQEALTVAEEALLLSAANCAQDTCDARNDVGARFHLFALKGHAYLSLRLGQLDEARQDLRRLRQLDPDDVLGASVLARVLARRTTAGDEDEADGAARDTLRGWPMEDMRGH